MAEGSDKGCSRKFGDAHSIAQDVKDLRIRLGGLETEAMHGDNLAIMLCSFFEEGLEDPVPDDDSGCWDQRAVDAANAVMDAIHEHYTRGILTRAILAAHSIMEAAG